MQRQELILTPHGTVTELPLNGTVFAVRVESSSPSVRCESIRLDPMDATVRFHPDGKICTFEQTGDMCYEIVHKVLTEHSKLEQDLLKCAQLQLRPRIDLGRTECVLVHTECQGDIELKVTALTYNIMETAEGHAPYPPRTSGFRYTISLLRSLPTLF